MDDNKFKIVSKYQPTGDQPEAIKKLIDGVKNNKRVQVLLGATGTGKTFTMANVIESLQRPALVLVHNKTLASQLYVELKELFPNNRVEYFVSNFDFYQPEAYLPKTDTYIEKAVLMNQEIEMMRSAAINSILERRDTIVVASVAAIYGLTDPDEYRGLVFSLRVGEPFSRNAIGEKLVNAIYERNNYDKKPGTFAFKGDMLEISPAYTDKHFIRVYSEDDVISEIDVIDSQSLEILHTIESFPVYPAYEHASSFDRVKRATKTIREELAERLNVLHLEGKYLEEQRLKMRTMHDLDSLEEMGICPGVENYSRHIDGRKSGETPFTLFDYFPDDYILFADESHTTLPQIRGMYNGDRARKINLVEYGFRLPSALDNRPLRFEEFEGKFKNLICTSATPGDYELEQAGSDSVYEQIIRPTGLLDPIIEVRPTSINPVNDLLKEIKDRIKRNERVLVVSLTISDAKNLTEFYKSQGIKVEHLQHEIKTLERTELIYKLRKGIIEVLVGINLLREGLDIPEVSLIAILSADMEGFLRSTRSLIQIIGRAARNSEGKVIMYADNISRSMKEAIEETKRRRAIQEEYNEKHGIVPKTIIKPITEPIKVIDKKRKKTDSGYKTRNELESEIKRLEKEMREAARSLDFEEAANLRDAILELKDELLRG